jgi:hypothetical protein
VNLLNSQKKEIKLLKEQLAVLKEERESFKQWEADLNILKNELNELKGKQKINKAQIPLDKSLIETIKMEYEQKFTQLEASINALRKSVLQKQENNQNNLFQNELRDINISKKKDNQNEPFKIEINKKQPVENMTITGRQEVNVPAKQKDGVARKDSNVVAEGARNMNIKSQADNVQANKGNLHEKPDIFGNVIKEDSASVTNEKVKSEEKQQNDAIIQTDNMPDATPKGKPKKKKNKNAKTNIVVNSEPKLTDFDINTNGIAGAKNLNKDNMIFSTNIQKEKRHEGRVENEKEVESMLDHDAELNKLQDSIMKNNKKYA